MRKRTKMAIVSFATLCLASAVVGASSRTAQAAQGKHGRTEAAVPAKKPQVMVLATEAGPPGTRPMDPGEVAALYRGKTWMWSDGAGYFDPDTNFVAWSGSGVKLGHAEGRWVILADGRLCMRATWYVKTGGAKNSTCFDHRTAAGAIYQKRLPDGQWYVLRNAPPKSDDEYAKFRDGDLAGAKAAEVRRALANR